MRDHCFYCDEVNAHIAELEAQNEELIRENLMHQEEYQDRTLPRIAELEAENEELKKQIETINALAGEPMPDIITRTST